MFTDIALTENLLHNWYIAYWQFESKNNNNNKRKKKQSLVTSNSQVVIQEALEIERCKRKKLPELSLADVLYNDGNTGLGLEKKMSRALYW